MSKRPVIGFPTQTLEPIGDEIPRSWIMSQRYVSVLTSVGAVPWVIPLLKDEPETLRGIYERLDGLFLAGGVDIDPSAYGAARHRLCGRTDSARDATELTLARWAIEDHTPILAVCRGIQLINVAAGGSLYQDINDEYPNSIKHDYFPTAGHYARDLLVHSISTVEETQLRKILGVPHVKVNSMHHQSIKDVAPGLVVAARAPDGVIEAIESPNGHYMVGVQWHPEELAESDPRMRRLFTSFIDAARAQSHASEQAA